MLKEFVTGCVAWTSARDPPDRFCNVTEKGKEHSMPHYFRGDPDRHMLMAVAVLSISKQRLTARIQLEHTYFPGILTL
jgi:hypothetical protein